MLRALLIFFLAGTFARLEGDTPPSKDGISNSVAQPHVRAELISEVNTVTLGKPFLVALHLHMDPNWHTYWINPGDAGLATTIKWTLPPGFTAGPIQWPTPQIHKMGPLTTYGYADDVYLLTTITPPSILAGYLPPHLEIKARADWLVCQEECIPGKAELILPLAFNARGQAPVSSDKEELLNKAKALLPVANTRWEVKAGFEPRGAISQPGQQVLVFQFTPKPDTSPNAIGHLYFFAEQGNVVDPKQNNVSKPDPETKGSFNLILDLQQNGEKPGQISGVLVSDRPLIGDSKAVYIAAVPTTAQIPLNWAALENEGKSQGTAATSSVIKSDPYKGPLYDDNAPPLYDYNALRQEQPFLIAVLGAAFLGGLILNLMPCVLPVLSLKVFSLIRHAGTAAPWKQGVAFTIGVILSFWILAGLLIALRAAGNHLGWGFQMQSPGFVLALILLFFLLGLNLLGVFEIGTSLVGLDAKAAGHAHSGLTSSFLNGALATLAATPCTAPFMGSSVGFAAEQPPIVALLVFTALALGMAAPYLLLTIFPAALRFVPKPGAWMEAVRQVMGFLLLATVIFLIYVYGALVGQGMVPVLLSALLLVGAAVWIYGRWKWLPTLIFILVLAATLFALRLDARPLWTPAPASNATTQGDWKPWSTAAVDEALAKNQPAFVDFTAAWCLSCKVNERVALESDAVKQAFTRKHVALFRADWTHSDPTISAILEKYHRDGVPLYLLYSPPAKDTPQILPEVLTPGIVLDAVNKLP